MDYIELDFNEDFEDAILHLEAKRFTQPLVNGTAIFRVYIGNSEGEQVASFKSAMGRVRATLDDRCIDMTIEFMSLKRMRDEGLNFEMVIDWLLGSHFHFVITHPHQGLESSGWSIAYIYQQVKRLWYHPGFPMLEKLKCPVFCQDKYKYVFHLGEENVSPTLRLMLPEGSDAASHAETVSMFLGTFPADTAFVMKAPFVTNKQHFHYYVERDVQAILRILHRLLTDMYWTKQCQIIPYIMLQERVKDNREIKAVFLGGEYNHMLSCNTANVVKSLPGFSHDEVVAFATSALNTMSQFDTSLLDGLARVDMFKGNSGQLVVNEIESLEARFFTTNENEMFKCQTFLEDYWERQIYNALLKLP